MIGVLLQNTSSRRGFPTPVTASTLPSTNFAALAASDPVYTSLYYRRLLLILGRLDPRRVLLLLIFGGLDVTCVDVVVRVCCACMFCAPVPPSVHSDIHPSISPACTLARAPATLRRPPAAGRPRPPRQPDTIVFLTLITPCMTSYIPKSSRAEPPMESCK